MPGLRKVKNITFKKEFILEACGFFAYEYDVFIEFLNKGNRIFYVDNIYIMKRIILFLLSKRNDIQYKGVYNLFLNNHYYKIFIIEQANRLKTMKFEEYLSYYFNDKCGTREKLLCLFELDNDNKEYIVKSIMSEIRKNIF